MPYDAGNGARGRGRMRRSRPAHIDGPGSRDLLTAHVPALQRAAGGIVKQTR
ncbi:hypothetical protein C8E95_6615 [Pseudonocardia autotrophica]|uniref:Uncharacterized protein n=1 Tax=Pseudonocardia autotrophica TaxID=2074 RepID=A0A1Y2N5Q5_PSEAH|nr:hypothetical protein BG845_01033 [Pseudonocardia autotrophica]TDN77369.1 hypothetical protein C8E95_6615 [Pseudonocardia autotrophica]